jgi:hypothetical protein
VRPRRYGWKAKRRLVGLWKWFCLLDYLPPTENKGPISDTVSKKRSKEIGCTIPLLYDMSFNNSQLLLRMFYILLSLVPRTKALIKPEHSSDGQSTHLLSTTDRVNHPCTDDQSAISQYEQAVLLGGGHTEKARKRKQKECAEIHSTYICFPFSSN